MAATGKTPILLYGSTTPTNAPTAGNLTNSSDGCEIAINVADKNLFFKDSTNAVNTVPIRQSSASSNGWLSSTDWSTFNNKVSSQWTTSGSDIYYTSGNVEIGSTTNFVLDQIGAARPLVVQSSDSSTTVAGSANSITICNSNTTTNNTSQINFAAITGANTNQYSSAVISAIHGARTNGQYPAGQIAFSTSSATNLAPTEKMRIDSSGNVGIGTISPTATAGIATVIQNATQTSYRMNNGTNYFDLILSGNDAYVWNRNSAPMLFGTNNSERMRIFATGGVSIGNTTDPGATNLSVTGTGKFGGNLQTNYGNVITNYVDITAGVNKTITITPTVGGSSPVFTLEVNIATMGFGGAYYHRYMFMAGGSLANGFGISDIVAPTGTGGVVIGTAVNTGSTITVALTANVGGRVMVTVICSPSSGSAPTVTIA